MNYTIREADVNDMTEVFNLIQELADFEKEPDEVEITVSDLKKDGYGENSSFTCFVAELNDTKQIVGIALVYMRYSTWKGKALHLEDLIVKQSMRGTGLGTALLDKVVMHGNALGVKRIGWEVLDWNEPAIKFYEKKGAHVMRDWNVVQLREVGIKDYIKNI